MSIWDDFHRRMTVVEKGLEKSENVFTVPIYDPTITMPLPTGILVQDEGSSLPVRSKLNFIGSGVTAADDSANDRINVTIPGGGSSFSGVEHELLIGSGQKSVYPRQNVLWTSSLYHYTESGTPLVTIPASPNNDLVKFNSIGYYEVSVWGRGDPTPNATNTWWSIEAGTGISYYLYYTHVMYYAAHSPNGTLNYDPLVSFTDFVYYPAAVDPTNAYIYVPQSNDTGTWGSGSNVLATMLIKKLG